MKLEGVLSNIVFELGKYIETVALGALSIIIDIMKISFIFVKVALNKTVK